MFLFVLHVFSFNFFSAAENESSDEDDSFSEPKIPAQSGLHLSSQLPSHNRLQKSNSFRLQNSIKLRNSVMAQSDQLIPTLIIEHVQTLTVSQEVIGNADSTLQRALQQHPQEDEVPRVCECVVIICL